MSPFKDRELSEYEAYQRLQYWKKDAERETITLKVTMLSRIGLALSKPKEVRSDVENYIVAVYHALEKKVHEMETPAEEGDTS
jgi:vacuolar-type H+-ATPase subunit E/Vma4